MYTSLCFLLPFYLNHIIRYNNKNIFKLKKYSYIEFYNIMLLLNIILFYVYVYFLFFLLAFMYYTVIRAPFICSHTYFANIWCIIVIIYKISLKNRYKFTLFVFEPYFFLKKNLIFLSLLMFFYEKNIVIDFPQL